MISYRKNECKLTNIAKPELFRSLFIDQALFLSFFVLWANGLISVPFVIERSRDCLIDPLKPYEPRHYRPPNPVIGYISSIWPCMCKSGMAVSCAHSILTIYKHMIATKQNYKDAIEIKNLLMKSDSEASQVAMA